MLRAVAIDDEPMALEVIKSLSVKIPFLQLQACFTNAFEAMGYLKKGETDLIFLDIKMPDISGMDLMRSLSHPPMVIFTTAYSEHAIRAFKVNSIDYLLKPIDKAELKAAIEKFRKLTANGDNRFKSQLETLVGQIRLAKENNLYKERFIAHQGKSMVVIDHSRIAYFLKDTLIYIVTNDKQQLVTDFQTMEEVEEVVDPKFFYRANRQYIVNINSVDSFRSDIYSKILLKLKSPNDISIDISREKAQAFRKWVQ